MGRGANSSAATTSVVRARATRFPDPPDDAFRTRAFSEQELEARFQGFKEASERLGVDIPQPRIAFKLGPNASYSVGDFIFDEAREDAFLKCRYYITEGDTNVVAVSGRKSGGKSSFVREFAALARQPFFAFEINDHSAEAIELKTSNGTAVIHGQKGDGERLAKALAEPTVIELEEKDVDENQAANFEHGLVEAFANQETVIINGQEVKLHQDAVVFSTFESRQRNGSVGALPLHLDFPNVQDDFKNKLPDIPEPGTSQIFNK